MTKMEWNQRSHFYEGVTSDGCFFVQVEAEAVHAEQEHCPEEDWPDADDWASDFNDRDEATVIPIPKPQ